MIHLDVGPIFHCCCLRMADWEKTCGKGLSEVSVGESRRLEG